MSTISMNGSRARRPSRNAEIPITHKKLFQLLSKIANRLSASTKPQEKRIGTHLIELAERVKSTPKSRPANRQTADRRIKAAVARMADAITDKEGLLSKKESKLFDKYCPDQRPKK